MKKIFLAAALIFSVAVSQFVTMSRAEAEDIFLGTWEGGWNAYWYVDSTKLLDDSTKTSPHFSCQVKAISPQGTVKYINYNMLIEIVSSSVVRITFRDSLGGSGSFYSNNVGVYQVEEKLAKGLMILFNDLYR